MSTEKATRYRRTKADITEDIRKAAVDQVMKRGFSASLVTEIIKKAKIEPPVFYHRYKTWMNSIVSSSRVMTTGFQKLQMKQ